MNQYDDLHRRTVLEAGRTSISPQGNPSDPGSHVFTHQVFTYDDASRLKTVSEGDNQAVYQYLANSPLVEQIDFKNQDQLRMTTRKAYDRLNRLTLIESLPVNDEPLRYAYDYNLANQRTKVEMADGTGWEYDYDNLGQLTKVSRTGANQGDEKNRLFEYAYDDIGNRKKAVTDDEELQYEADALNRYKFQ